MPEEPWYYTPGQLACDPKSITLCGTCRRIKFEWLLCNDLASTRASIDEHHTPRHLGSHEILLGGFSEVCGRSKSCSFCGLVLSSFRQAYRAITKLEQLQPPRDKDPMLQNTFYQRVTLAGKETFVSVGESEQGVFEIRTRAWIPPVETIDPSIAFFELDNVEKGDEDSNTRSYALRVFLCTAKGGQRVASVDFHKLVEDPIPFQGRMWNNQIDPKLIRHWFENLPAQAEKGTNFLPPVIRPHFCLIDAEKECVVKVQEPSQYVALSYVWGDPNTNRVLNKKEKRPFLMKPGGVSLSDPKLPKTIHDAMRLVLATGHRYLWVDALCVSQDPDPGSSHGKTAQLENMDSIYRCAKFTIIAVSGEDDNAGLPGIRDGTRTWQPHILWLRGIKLSSRPPTQNSLTTTWGSRAWTLQEEVFSARKLYFSSHTMRLRHENGFFDEDLHPQRVLGDHDPESKNIKSLRTNFTIYADFVKHYTSRSMTNNTDVINAFQGILTALRSSFRGDFLVGLPSTELEHALLWLPVQPVERRFHKQESGVNKSVRTIVPAGPGLVGKGNGVAFSTRDVHQLDSDLGHWDTVFAEVQQSTPFYREPSSRQSKLPRNTSSWDFRVVGQHFELPGQNIFHRKLHIDPQSSVTVFEHPIAPENREGIPLRSQSTFIREDTGTLAFLALIAKFKICRGRVRLDDFGPARRTFRGVETFALQDDFGNFAGAVGLHDKILQEATSNEEYHGSIDLVVISRTNNPYYQEIADISPPEDDGDAQETGTNMCEDSRREDEFLPAFSKQIENAASMIQAPSDPDTPTSKQEDGHYRCYDFNKHWCLYDVLVIRWRGEIAERIGVGRCHVDAFWRCKPERKEILLQ